MVPTEKKNYVILLRAHENYLFTLFWPIEGLVNIICGLIGA